MSKIKGIDLVNLRTLIRKKFPAVEERLLSKLTKKEQILYLSALTTTWNPVEIQDAIYLQAGKILFPQDKEKHITLGKMVAEISYTGIYKVFLRMLTPKIAAQCWVKIWHFYHDTGQPSYVLQAKRHYRLFVRNYPSLPAVTRQLITGHVIKMSELTKLKEFTVRAIEDNPENWCWEVLWKA